MFQSTMNVEIHFAPLQGYTDAVYRKTFCSMFNDVDYYYSPYISVENSGKLLGNDDIAEFEEHTIIQILPGNLGELKMLVSEVNRLGYTRLNINMGCPYPMVINKGRGAALMQKPNFVADCINYIHDYTELKLSLKMRSGLKNPNEIFDLLRKILLQKVSEIIVHPRLASQLYKGKADVLIVSKCLTEYPDTKFIYNGDIFLYNDFIEKGESLLNLNSFMLGRGLLMNPFLAEQIKSGRSEFLPNYTFRLFKFMTRLVDEIILDSKDAGHALNRCKNQLGYLLIGFPEFKKLKKKIIKEKSVDGLKLLLNNVQHEPEFSSNDAFHNNLSSHIAP